MLIESTSKYYLKRIRAKAKLYEYHIPDELHGTIEDEVNRLIISAIGIIGDFSEAVINSFNRAEFNYEDFRDEINFAAKFFDGYVDSKLCLQDEEEANELCKCRKCFTKTFGRRNSKLCGWTTTLYSKKK